MRASVAAIALIAGCSRPPSVDARASAADAGIDAGSNARPMTSGAPAPRSPRELLAAAPLERLSLEKPPAFTATLATPEGPRAIRVTIATIEAPVAHRRALAFERLARAMGARSVPLAALRSPPAGDVAALAQDAGGWLHDHASVLADGTLDLLLRSPGRADDPWRSPRLRAIASDDREAQAWARAAALPLDAAPLDAHATDYVEALALDYLSAIPARRLFYATDDDRLLVDDDGQAFPVRPDADALASLLRRVRAIARFPRSLRAGLVALDRSHAEAAFASGAFEDALLSPRSITELLERRATLLSLVEARIGAQGEAATLTP